MGAVSSDLDNKLAAFLRSQRGDMPYAQFAKKLGIGVGTLHRLENGGQSITLQRLDQILKRLKCNVSEVFKAQVKS